jgi:hypothetical protein
VAEVLVVEQLVQMEQLDRVTRVETRLVALGVRVVAVAVARVLLVRMDHLAHQVTAGTG